MLFCFALGVLLAFLVSCTSPTSNNTTPPPDITMKQISVGMWITGEWADTGVQVKDSLNTKYQVYDTSLHHTWAKVTGTTTAGADVYYVVSTSDTALKRSGTGVDNITPGTLYVKQTATELVYAYPPSGWNADTLFITVLKTPISAGAGWQTELFNFDTTVRLVWNLIPVKLSLSANVTGNAQVAEAVSYQTSSGALACRRITGTTTTLSRMVSDTGISILGINLISVGDTIARSSETKTTSSYQYSGCPLALWSSEFTTKLDTNYIDSVTTRDTTRKVSFLKRFYDPYSSDTVVFKP
jgi:hypothetical protein